MSAKNGQAEAALKVAVLWGLVGCSGIVAAADEELPDLDFLEYLGSWEESDEEWLLFNEGVQEAAAQEESQRNDSPEEGAAEGATAGKESTELENES